MSALFSIHYKKAAVAIAIAIYSRIGYARWKCYTACSYLLSSVGKEFAVKKVPTDHLHVTGFNDKCIL